MLKRDLLVGLPEKTINDVIDFLEDTEIEIAQESDLVICVTERDAEWFRRNGANNVVSVNNGTNAKLSYVTSNRHYALIVGSGHPPNIEGSIKYLSDATEWLPPDTNLIFVGTMCDALRGNLGKEYNEERQTRIVFLGKVSDDDLDKLVESANVIALPIPYGGGSNLKTAEALVSGRPVVGTSTSFRGFEDFISSEFVIVADSVYEFQDFVSQACRVKYPTTARDGYKSLTWNGTTQTLKDYLRSISGTSS
jgi:glycosyltransferase involved in cell wall biosynthesis